jgi:Kinesin motor domain
MCLIKCCLRVHRESKLSLIDLAGSERASATNNTGALLRQGASINKSLLSLANCINALASNARNAACSSSGSAASAAAAGSASGAGRAPTNVKYRDSKLTHLLKTSLEGQCRLIMIANVNPSHTMYDDSHNTLKYANRAKDIKVAPRAAAGEKESAAWPAREARLQREVQALREANAELRAQLEHAKALQLEHGGHSSSSSSSAALALLTTTQHATEEEEDEYERSLAGHAWEADSLREADERTEDYQSPTKKRRLAAAAAAAAAGAALTASAEDTDGEHSAGSSRQRRTSGSGAAARIAQLERTLREVTEAGGSSSSASATVAQLQRERSEARARAADLEARVDELTHTREVMSQLNEEWRGRKDEAEAAAVAERAAADACLRQLRAREKDNAALRSDLELLRRQLADATACSGGGSSNGSSSAAAAASPALQQQRPATTLGIALTRGRRSMTPQQQHRVASVSEEGLPPASAAAAAVVVDNNSGGLHLSMPGGENDAEQLGAAMKRTRSRRSSMIPRCVTTYHVITEIVYYADV